MILKEVCNAVYFRLCIYLMHITPPVTAEGYDAAHHPRYAERIDHIAESCSDIDDVHCRYGIDQVVTSEDCGWKRETVGTPPFS